MNSKEEVDLDSYPNFPVKKKRQFTWTPARRAAFEKCVAANKCIQNKKIPQGIPQIKRIVNEEEESSESDNETSSSIETISSEEEVEVRKPKKKNKRSCGR